MPGVTAHAPLFSEGACRVGLGRPASGVGTPVWLRFLISLMEAGAPTPVTSASEPGSAPPLKTTEVRLGSTTEVLDMSVTKYRKVIEEYLESKKTENHGIKFSCPWGSND